MGSIGAYILLDLAASPYGAPTATVWQGLCDGVLGAFPSAGLRVSVIGYSDTASVLLDGVVLEAAMGWMPPREMTGLSNLNLALSRCLELLGRAPSSEIPFIILASGGLVTDEGPTISRRWTRLTAGIPRYALLTGRPLPGIPFPAYGAPAGSVYRLDSRELDCLSRDLSEELSRPTQVPEAAGSDDNNISHNETVMNDYPSSDSRMPSVVSETNLPMTQNLFHSLGLFDDETCELLTRQPSLISRFLPSAKQKILDEIHQSILKANGRRYVEACRVIGEAQIRALSEQVNDFLIRSAVDFRAETVKQALRRHTEVIRAFSANRDELLEQLSADFDKIEKLRHPVLRKQYEKSLEAVTEKIFGLYEDMGKYFSDFLNARVGGTYQIL